MEYIYIYLLWILIIRIASIIGILLEFVYVYI